MSLNEGNDFLQDDWPGEDFMDSLLKMDDRMLFSTGPTPTDADGGPDELDEFMIRLSKSYAASEAASAAASLGTEVMSPLSSHASSDVDFHGFPSVTGGSSSGGASLDGFLEDDYTSGQLPAAIGSKPLPMNVDFTMLGDVLEPDSPAGAEQETLSSAASDSGLSSDHLDLDPNTEYEALSPALSSPGPSISERGGQNSPQRYVKLIQPAASLVQKSAEAPGATGGAAGGAGVVQTLPITVQSHRQERVLPQQQQQQKLISKTATHRLTPQHVSKTSVGNLATAGVVHQPMKPVPVAPKRIVSAANCITTTGGVGTQQQLVGSNGKELKIIRMATMKNGQTVAVANGLTTVGSSAANKKVMLQLKSPATANGGALVSKSVLLTSTPASSTNNGGGGVRKIIRMQQQQQQQQHQNGRPILVPVTTIQDLRTIKIVNSSNLKSKSANIKLAAANLLQQSKQGLIQKHVVLSSDQLLTATDDGSGGLSDAGPSSSSDSESYVFEDIMQQSSSVIAEVERHQQQQQQHLISDSDVEPDGDDDMDDDDGDLDEIGNKGRNRNGTYQKLVLTAEEKRLLAKEGITLPTSYPLTKHEERELKRIRRKIRNKISAQDSRKRKKEYVDGLEERVKQCTEENQNLVKRIKILQSQNHDLVSQMKRIQSLLTKGTSKTTQPATCLMVLLISMALVAVPNLKLGNTASQQNIQDSLEMAELRQEPANDKLQVQQSRRSLLFNTNEQQLQQPQQHNGEDELSFDELMSSFNANSLIANEHDYFTDAVEGVRGGGGGGGVGGGYDTPPQAKRARVAPTTLIDYDVDDDVWNGGRKLRIKEEPAGSMSPDSSSSGGGGANGHDLFEQKMREFQETLRDVEQELRSSEALSNSELIVDRDLLELVAKKENGLYELNLDTFSALQSSKGIDGAAGIDLLGGVGGGAGEATAVADTTGPDAGNTDARKLNASQQIQQQNNNKRKLLL